MSRLYLALGTLLCMTGIGLAQEKSLIVALDPKDKTLEMRLPPGGHLEVAPESGVKIGYSNAEFAEKKNYIIFTKTFDPSVPAVRVAFDLSTPTNQNFILILMTDSGQYVEKTIVGLGAGWSAYNVDFGQLHDKKGEPVKGRLKKISLKIPALAEVGDWEVEFKNWTLAP